MEMVAAVVENPGERSYSARCARFARDDEIIVRIAGVGLCHTDIVAQMARSLWQAGRAGA